VAASDCFISVVAPVHNDSAIVESFIREVMAVLQEHYMNYELVLIDDGSEDETVATITALLSQYRCIRLIRLSRRFGEEIAVSAALDSAIGDFVVMMRPNFDPPALIPKMVQHARNGAGIVFGVRNSRSDEPLLVRMGAALFYWYCKKIVKINILRGSTLFRVLSRQAVNAVMQIKDRHRYLRHLSSHVGFASQSFPYEPISRDGNTPTRSFLDALNLAINIVIKYSRHPLRFVSWFGVLASLVNMLYTGFVIYSYLFGDDIAEGWTTLSLQTAVLFFFVFLILTVLSEYIGHIFVELETRPLYYVLEERTSSVLISDQARKNVVTDPVGDDLVRASIVDTRR
jgi:dolichol-phosphate mannosyltransferase